MPRPRIFPAIVAVLAIVVATSLSACVQQPSHAFVAPSASDAKWGAAPALDPGVTLQPDVVIIDGGAASIKQVTSDGLTWVLKKNATGVSQLAVGKVMFVTGNGVGRVINLHSVGNDTAVTVAPVSITDVVRDGDFTPPKPVGLGQNAIAFGTPSIYSDSDLLDQVGQPDAFAAPGDDALGVVGGSGQGVRWPTDIVPPIPSPPIPSPAIPKLPDGVKRELATAGAVARQVQQQDGNFDVTRTLSAQNEGTSFSYDHNGVRLNGSLSLTTSRPTADFQLKISGGSLTLAEFKLAGAGAVHARVEAATQPGGQVIETSKWIGEALGFEIPVGKILGVPFSIWVGNQFKIQIRLPGDSYIKSAGDFSLDASMGFRYANNKFENLTGAHFNAETSAQKSDSISVGLSGLTVWDEVSFRVGIGFLGFSAGVDFLIDFRVNLEMGAPIGFSISQNAADPVEKCRRVAGYVGVQFGVGLSMPAPVVAVINWFLKVFNSPPIPKNISEHDTHDFPPVDKIYPASGFCQ